MTLYELSVHAQALQQGNLDAPTCTACHRAHGIRRARDPSASINPQNVSRTCGACHKEALAEYTDSIHWQSRLKGASDAPVCTTCHGEHAIRSPEDPEAFVFSANIPLLCAECHESQRMIEKYELPPQRLTTFHSTFHGLALRGGATDVATCSSCHANHLILPSEDPRSSIHPANLGKTCAQCHPGAGTVFQISNIHGAPQQFENQVIRIVTVLYILLIIVLVGAMLFHNMLDLFRKMRNQIKFGTPARESTQDAAHIRFNYIERTIHVCLIVSFFILVYTGFTLTFPEAFFAWPILQLEEGFAVRAILHRIAAIVLLGAVLCVTGLILFTNRGRTQFRSLLPRMGDLRDLSLMVKHNLSLTDTRPRFGKYGYVEKIEFWGVFWGTVIMTITGIVLWGETFALTFLPKWVLDLMTVIHFYEAILALLTILVWHLYWTIFNPDIYPLNMTFITGRISWRRLKEHHPLDPASQEEDERGQGKH